MSLLQKLLQRIVKKSKENKRKKRKRKKKEIIHDGFFPVLTNVPFFQCLTFPLVLFTIKHYILLGKQVYFYLFFSRI